LGPLLLDAEGHRLSERAQANLVRKRRDMGATPR
jgi:hypothetical protein